MFGPGVAQKLKHVYQEYLSLFDQTYFRSVIAKQSQVNQQRVDPLSSQGSAPSNGGDPALSNGPSNANPTGMQPQLNVPAFAAQLGTNDPTKVSQMMQMSFMSLDELRQ